MLEKSAHLKASTAATVHAVMIPVCFDHICRPASHIAPGKQDGVHKAPAKWLIARMHGPG
jgi:hypothetical protein